MKLQWNEETRVISIGDFKTDKYISFTLKEWTSAVLRENKKILSTWPAKDFYKDATEFLECTPSVLYKIFNKLQYKHFVVPYLEYVNKIGFNKRGVDPITLSKIVKSKDLLDQVKEDNLINLIPFVCKYNKSPAELKVMFGKHWKKIANNSLHKNKYLLNYKEAGEYAEFPTTLLMQRDLTRSSVNLMKHLTLYYKGKWRDISKNKEVIHLFRDTERLALSLDKAVNPSWTPRRLKEEHDRMTKEVNARMYPKENYEVIKGIQTTELTYQDLVAVLIKSPYDLAEEGTSMGHCVASYDYQVKEGSYLVYSVRDKDMKRLSTIGVSIDKYGVNIIYPEMYGKTIFSKHQHYGKYNSIVTCEKQKAIAEQLIVLLNKTDKSYKN